MFEDTEDLHILEVAAKTFGHLVRSGGAMMADVVEKEVSHTCMKQWIVSSMLA